MKPSCSRGPFFTPSKIRRESCQCLGSILEALLLLRKLPFYFFRKLSDRECGNFHRSRALAAPTWAWWILDPGSSNLPYPGASGAPLRPFARLSGTLCPTAVACSNLLGQARPLGIAAPMLLPAD